MFLFSPLLFPLLYARFQVNFASLFTAFVNAAAAAAVVSAAAGGHTLIAVRCGIFFLFLLSGNGALAALTDIETARGQLLRHDEDAVAYMLRTDIMNRYCHGIVIFVHPFINRCKLSCKMCAGKKNEGRRYIYTNLYVAGLSHDGMIA